MLLVYTACIVCPQIEQIKVNFARQAKRINMQKLKSSMWTIITEKQPDRTSVSFSVVCHPQASPSCTNNTSTI